MDGGDKQQDMARAIKAQVKQSASSRKDSNFKIKVFATEPNQVTHIPASKKSSSAESSPGTKTPASENAHEGYPNVDTSDDFFITLYLDTVFPVLFPWYQPPALSGGRSWILVVLKANKAIFHTTMSLSLYYFTLLIAKEASHTVRTPCEQYVWDSLAKHVDTSMQVIRQDMDSLNTTKHADVFQRASALEGIVQLLILETAMATGADWDVHLSAAVAVFTDIFREHGTRDGVCHLPSVDIAMHKPSILDSIRLSVPVLDPNQAAFRFYSAVLIYADIISSVSLGTAPRLRYCYKGLIEDIHEEPKSADLPRRTLQMENYIGCQGWVLLLVGEISALDAWKRSVSPKSRSCEAEELEQRSRVLELKLQHGEDALKEHSRSYLNASAGKQVSVTEAWIHAAKIYLSTVKKGWDPNNPVIRSNVESALLFLGQLSPELCLRSLLWPLCVSGFLATPEQEPLFREYLSALGPLKAFGAARQALQLLERVWGLRGQLGREEWGMSDCFEVGGKRVLLL